MFDVVAIGELLIDFTPSGLSTGGNVLFEQNPGGAPANVLASLSKLGRKTAFIGMVGDDGFGLFLRDILIKKGINVSGLRVSKQANTTLAFIHLDSTGDRSFSFYRNPGADMLLNREDIDYGIIKSSRIFHFGSLSMTNEPIRSATLAAVQFAKDNSLIISYDPNFRPALWTSIEQAVNHMKVGLAYADIVKVSEAEMELLTGTADLSQGSLVLYAAGCKVVLITLGAQGCYYKYPGGEGLLTAYSINVVDTTGAGDAFFGAFLYRVGNRSLAEISSLPLKEFEDIIDFANAAGGISATSTGAIPEILSVNSIDRLRQNSVME